LIKQRSRYGKKPRSVRDERLDLCLPAELKTQIEQAASLVGQSVSAFILGLAVPCAREVIRDAGLIELSERDSRRFLEALDDDDSDSSPALIRAADRARSVSESSS